ncbi:hypothetical protein EMIT047CA2_120063 [Pseudomonas soli]
MVTGFVAPDFPGISLLSSGTLL